MPCLTETRMSVEFKAAHFDLVERAIKSARHTVRRERGYVSFLADHGPITIYGDGRIELDERDRASLNAVKRQYSREAVKKAARQYEWVLHEPSKNKFLARKR